MNYKIIRVYINGRKKPIILEVSNHSLERFREQFLSNNFTKVSIGQFTFNKENIDYVEYR